MEIKTLRKYILGYTIFLVVAIGVPWFFYTTSIHRAELPIDKINDFAETVDITSVVYFNVSAAQSSIVERINVAGVEGRRWNDQVSSDEYVVNIDIGDKDSVFVEPFSKIINVRVSSATSMVTGKVEELISRTLTEMFKTESSSVVIPYSPHYNIIFSLFIEDGTPINWDSHVINKLFNPLLQQLDHISNFTIFTQVQYYSRSTSPKELVDGKYVIKDLTNFVNYGDWNLNNHDIDPSINFIVYYPASNHDGVPTLIENSHTNSFVIPQYGGVYILNKQFDIINDNEEIHIVEEELIPALEVFSGQLLKLLGDASNTKNLGIKVDLLTKKNIIKQFHLTIKTLKSLVKLTNDLDEISIPELTKLLVNQSLENLANGVTLLQNHDFKESMLAVAKGWKESQLAFFDKDIVQQVYFPSEHKLAVFLPLLGPICLILLFSSIREIKAAKQ